MEKTIRILEFDDIKEKLVSLIKNYSLIPVIGAGFSCGSKTANGIVPNGTSMKNHMIETLKIEEGITGLKDKKFSKVATYYNRMIDAKLRKKYISDNFIGVRLNAAQKAFLNIKWPYLYSLNIDDAIEFNSNFRPIGPNKQFENNFLDYGNVVFKLHGDAKDIVYLKDGEDFSIFDTQQYIKSLEKNKWILDQLKQDYLDKNILFIGCSLSDEIDLLHVFSDASNVVSHNITERYFLTDKMLNQMDLIDLENYGITVVVHVNSYDDFYNSFYQIKKEAELIEPQSLDFYKNIEIASLDIKSKKNQDYLLYEKTPFDIEKRKITLPYYFIERKTSTTIIDNLQTFPLHIVYGRRISGKSYMLLDIYKFISFDPIF